VPPRALPGDAQAGRHAAGQGRLDRALASGFSRLLVPFVDPVRGGRRRILLRVGVGLLVAAAVGMAGVKWVVLKMLPFDNKSEFQVVVDLPAGTPVEATAADLDDLAAFLAGLPGSEPVLFLGLGSNLLVRDGGFAGAVVSTHRALKGIEAAPPLGTKLVVVAGAGVPAPHLARFVARHGLSAYRMNPHFPVNTLLIMRGLVAAQAAGVGPAYQAAVLSAMWEKGLKMDDPAVVASVLAEAGLDAKALLEATQDPEVKGRLLAETEAAAARGAFGIPTFFVGDEMFFGKDRLAQVEEALSAG